MEDKNIKPLFNNILETERQKDRALRVDERALDNALRVEERALDNALRVEERTKDSQTRTDDNKILDDYNYAQLRSNQASFTKTLRTFSKTTKLILVIWVLSAVIQVATLLNSNHQKAEITYLKQADKTSVAVTLHNHQTALQNQKIECAIYMHDKLPPNGVCK